MASQYGYTPAQIFDLTPRQFQLLSARAADRRHDEIQMQIALAGGEPDFIDSEEEDAMKMAAKNSADQVDTRAIVAESLKKKQAEIAKNGKS